jgi:hypothetical protein
MRESARYAWWLLIFLFMLIILGNIAFFWTLFFQPGGKGLASSNQPLGVEFQVRYALAMERFGLGEETTRSVLQSAFEGMEKAFSPYEAAVYRLIVQSAFSAGDPKETLRLLPDLPSERLTAAPAPLAGSALARRAHPTDCAQPSAYGGGLVGRVAIAAGT